MQQVYYQEEIDKILDQYLAGKLSAEEVRMLHAKLQKGDLETFSEEDIANIELPQDLLHPNTKAEKMTERVFYASSGRNFAWTENPYHKYSLSNSKYTAIAAICLGLILLLPFVHLLLTVGKEQGLVAKYFSPHDMMPVQRAIENPEVENLWHSAILKYRSGNYAASAAALNQMFVYQLPDAYIDHFYMGICYIGTGQPREAIWHLTEAINLNTDSRLADLYNWYLSLAYVQSGNNTAAKSLLYDLEKTPSFIYHSRASKLLKEL